MEIAGGSIAKDTTLRGVVGITGDVLIVAAKITIDPGTTLLMGADSSIQFGWNGNVVSVFARGTETLPIRFCGRTATPGFWNKVSLGTKVTSDSVFENVVFSEGGQGTGAALETDSPVLIKSVLVSGSAGDGVHAVDFKDGSAALSVTNVAKVPVALLGPNAATHLPLGGPFTNNVNNVIAVRFRDTTVDTTFKNAGIPYLQEMSVTVSAPVTVTFAPGVDYRMAVDTQLEVGWNGNAASIIANGTAANPILFGAASPTAGLWKSLLIGHNVKSDSVLNWVTISGGGNGGPALDVHSTITLNNVIMTGNKTGLAADGAGLGATSTALTIAKTMGPPATVDLTNATTLPKGTYTGNTNDWIVIHGGSDLTAGNATLPNLGVPYRIEGSPTTSGSSALTIEAGTNFLMGADSYLEIGWNGSQAKLTAVGTAAAPIVFKGVEDGVGYWKGLKIGSMVSSKLTYVQVSNGGNVTGGGIELLRMGVDITNSKFSKSAGYGILKVRGDPTDYAAPSTGNTFDMNVLGPVGPLP
ncbi:MAG: hypothetical protein ABJA82_18145 [Myxococcales bacterium]